MKYDYFYEEQSEQFVFYKLHTFQEIAKEANAVYKVKRCVLVNLDLVNAYLEKCRVIGEGSWK